jgi:hypothetical protein
MAIGLAIWAAAACATPTAAPVADQSPAPAAVQPEITPAPVGPPVRIFWAPMTPQALAVPVRAEPGLAPVVRVPGLVPATAEALKTIEGEFVSHFTSGLGFIATLETLRTQGYNGSEEWMFATTFAPGPFADQVRALVTTRRENEIRTFQPGTATLENAWVRPSRGAFGNAASIGLVEGTVTFTDEVLTGGGKTTETHTWRIRALTQGQFFILDGAEAPAYIAPLAPFEGTILDTEIASQVASYLQQETFSPQWTPDPPYAGTAYWDARAAAISWLHDLTVRGALTDRHFEDMRAQVVRFTPTSYLGDGYATAHLQGTLVEVMNGVRHTYPVNESVVFQRFSFAQAWWMAVDGQNDDGTWIANGNYGTPQSTAHG